MFRRALTRFAPGSVPLGAALHGAKATGNPFNDHGEDGKAYTLALIAATSKSHIARDWVAGYAAAATEDLSLVNIALQHKATSEDIDAFIACAKASQKPAERINCFFYDALTAAMMDPDYARTLRQSMFELSEQLGLDTSHAMDIEKVVRSELKLHEMKARILGEEEAM